MPAICAPDSPWWPTPAVGPPPTGVLVFAGAVPVLDEVNSVGKVEKTGNLTPWHRPVVLDVTQHESVAFGVLPRQ